MAFLIAGLVGSSMVYWTFKWVSIRPYQPAAAVHSDQTETMDTLRISRLLGGGQSDEAKVIVENVAGRYKLLGVVAKTSQVGYALISTDGQPAKSYRVGAQVSESLILKAVSKRSVSLAENASASESLTLELLTPNGKE